MGKGLAIVACLLLLIVVLIYVERKNTDPAPSPDNSTDNKHHGSHGGDPFIPIIIPATLNLSVYGNLDCTSELTSIEWGSMCPGQNKSKTLYIKNTGNGDVKPAVYTGEWVFRDYNDTVLSPDYEQYFNLTLDVQGVTIKPSEIANATLKLAISPLIANVTDFAFNIHFGWIE